MEGLQKNPNPKEPDFEQIKWHSGNNLTLENWIYGTSRKCLALAFLIKLFSLVYMYI